MQAFPGGGRLANKVDPFSGQFQINNNSFNSHDLIRAKTNIQHSTVSTSGNFRMKGESSWNDVDNRNEVDLTWTPPANASGGYHVERDTKSDFSTAKEIGTSYGKHFNILNVGPKNAADGKWFESWMKMQNVAGTGPVDQGLFNITTVWYKDFNDNPGMLKNPDGTYKYDSIFFGAADWNSNNYDPTNQDLNAASLEATKAFGATGRAVTFGHDTVEGSAWGGMVDDGPYHTYFNYFAPLLGLQLSSRYKTVGSNKIQIATPGSLTENPYFLDPTVTYQISTSHSFRSYYMYNSGAIRWIRYDPANFNWGDGYAELKDASGNVIADNNWYLVSKNNYAQIQTGHSSGQCTPQEAQVIFNMIYYTSSLNTGTTGRDIIAKDVNDPNTPGFSVNSITDNDVSLKIDATDNPTNYYYRARADTSAGNSYSDIIKMPVLSGIQGYVYTTDDSATGTPTVTKDPATGKVTNINLTPAAGSTSGNVTFNRTDHAGKYLHIVAVDNNNNVSAVKTINLSDYLWWKYESGVLNIYQHRIDADVDAIISPGSELGDPNVQWPWNAYLSQIQKVVINPGVTSGYNLAHLFSNLPIVTSFVGLSNLDTTNALNMNSIFADCPRLPSIDISSFNTSNVTNMYRFFRRCPSLTSVKFGANFNTSKVNNFAGMFEGDTLLNNLDVSKFDTSSATYTYAMFSGCKSLESIDVSHFDMTKVTNANWMFYSDIKLKNIDTSGFVTSSLGAMQGMFYNCQSLEKLDLSGFDVSKVADMSELFRYCSKLSSLDLSNFKISATANTNLMLSDTTSLWKLKMGLGTKLGSTAGLANPTAETPISDLDNPTPVYYATNAQWREVGTAGTPHEPKGSIKTAAQIITESQTRNDVRTYVWDQIGKQTFTSTGASIDFGTHLGAIRSHEYLSPVQTLTVTDNRNVRSGKKWQITAVVNKPFTLTTDSTKKILGNPLYYQDTTNGILKNLNSTAQTLYNVTAGTGPSEINNYLWKLKFKSTPNNIPSPGTYKAQVTYTLVNDTP